MPEVDATSVDRRAKPGGGTDGGREAQLTSTGVVSATFSVILADSVAVLWMSRRPASGARTNG
ncbi:MAG: hypothetical protein AB1730_02100 [Myxococcota bacterium]